MPKIHGLELAKNSVFKYAVMESLASDPVLDVVGRVWFNTTSKTWKMSTLDTDGTTLVARTYATKEAVEAAAAQVAANLASTTAGVGSGLVGYAGKTTTNLTVVAGTVEASIDTVVVAIDADRVELQALDTRLDDVESKIGGDMGNLADLTTDAKSTVVASINEVDAHIDAEVTRATAAEGVLTSDLAAEVTRATAAESAEATRATAAEAAIQAEVDALETNVDTNYVKKTGTVAQEVTPDMIFNGSVRINGDLIQQGEVKVVMGEEVLFEDNIVILNSNVTAETAPTEDAGWGVNRGTLGELVVMKWDETNDVVKSVKSVDAEGVPTYDTIAFDSELQAVADAADARLDALEALVGGNVGDLATLTTDAKDSVVNAVNEVDAHIDAEVTRATAAEGVLTSDLAAEVTRATTAEAGLQSSITANADAIAANSAADAARISSEGSTTAGQGSGLIGFTGKTGVNGKYSVSAGTVESAVSANITAIDTDRKTFEDKVNAYASTVAGEGSALVGFSGRAATGDEPFGVAAGTTENALKAIVAEINNGYAELFMVEDKVDSLATQLNGGKYKTTSAAATSHTIVHNLNSLDITCNIWVKDAGSWKNHIVGVTIVDANTVQVDLTESYEVKVLVEKFDDMVI